MNNTFKSANKINGITLVLFGVSAVVFILFLILMSSHIRLCSDDLYFLNSFIEKGWFGSVAEFKYNIRWTSYLLFNSIFISNSDIQGIQINLIVYYLITIILFIASSFNLIRVLYKKLPNNKLSKKSALLLSCLLILAIYFSTSNVIEVWFWAIASTVYLYSIIFFILGVSEVISNSKSIFSYLIILFSFFFIGNASENFALCVMFLLFTLIMMKNIHKMIYIISLFNIKLLIAFISVLFPLILSYVSGGMGKRLDLETSAIDSDYNFDGVRILHVLLQLKNLIFVVFLGVFFIIGNIFSDKNIIIPKLNVSKWFLLNVILLLFFSLLTFLPLIIVFKNFGPERAWMPINLFTCFSLVFWSFYFGNRFGIKNNVASVVKYGFSIISILIIIIYSVRQFEFAFKFSSAYDKRIETIIKFRDSNNKVVIYLKPLPDSGVIASQELDANNGWTNNGLKKLLKLNYELKLDQK